MHACDVTSITTTEPVYDTVNMCRLKTVVQSIFTFREAMTTAKTEIEEAFASEFSDVCCLACAEGNQSLRDSQWDQIFQAVAFQFSRVIF